MIHFRDLYSSRDFADNLARINDNTEAVVPGENNGLHCWVGSSNGALQNRDQ